MKEEDNMSYEYINEDIEKYIIEMRRHFHENPELSWEEVETSKRILKELGCPQSK